MGCSESNQVIENRNKLNPTFSVMDDAGLPDCGDFWLMGEIKPGKYVFATIALGKIVSSSVDSTTKSAISYCALPSLVPTKEEQQEIYKPWNFSQMVRVSKLDGPSLMQEGGYLITGGINYQLNEITNTCSIFYPEANTVERISPLRQPRYTHSCTIHNGWAYVLGGRYFGDDDDAILNKCEKYCLKNHRSGVTLENDNLMKWTEIPPLNKSRCTFLSLVHHGKLWVVGGYTAEFQRSTVLEYLKVSEPDSGWTITAVELPFGIQSTVSLPTNPNQITIFGGNCDSGPKNLVCTLNFEQLTIRAEPKMKENRLLHKGVCHPKDKYFYIFGGNEAVNIQIYNMQSNTERQEHSVVMDIGIKEKFGSQETFESLTHSQVSQVLSDSSGPRPQSRSISGYSNEIVYILGTSEEPFLLQLNLSVPYALYHAIPLGLKLHALQGGIKINDGVYMIFGGISDSMDHVSKQVFLYNIKDNKFSRTMEMIDNRYAFAYQKIDDYVYAIGGGTADQEGQLLILNRVERYSISTGKWENVPHLPTQLISPMSLNYRQSLYVFGGMKITKERYQKILKFNHHTNCWVQLKFQFPFGIQAGSLYQQSDSEYLVFGGRVVNGDTKGIWSLTFIEDGNDCVFIQKGRMKQEKSLHKIVKPKKHNFFVIFGGETEPLSFYDCQSLQPIESDILASMKEKLLSSLASLHLQSLKNYLIITNE